MRRRDFIRHFGARVRVAVGGFLAVSRARAKSSASSGADQAAGEVGQIATLQGSATVTRGNPARAAALRVNDPIFQNDTLATGADSALGVTFDDQTTFSLSANTRIVVDEFIYQEGRRRQCRHFQRRWSAPPPLSPASSPRPAI